MINMSSECEYDWHWKISACSTEYEAYDFAHSPPIFIFWLGRLIFSVSINNRIHRFCLPMPFRFRKHKGHDLAYDVKIMTSQDIVIPYVHFCRTMCVDIADTTVPNLQTTYELCFGGNVVFWIFWIVWFFPRKYKYRCVRVYVWFKDDNHIHNILTINRYAL
jgi:hypothetical protein